MIIRIISGMLCSKRLEQPHQEVKYDLAETSNPKVYSCRLCDKTSDYDSSSSSSSGPLFVVDSSMSSVEEEEKEGDKETDGETKKKCYVNQVSKVFHVH